MINVFKNIEYGTGNRPYCKFNLIAPAQTEIIGNIYRIDAVLSEDLQRIDVWLISDTEGKIYYPLIKKRLKGNIGEAIYNAVLEVVRLTKECTKKNREENYVSFDADTLRETVSKIVRKKLYEHRNIIYNLDACIRVIEEQWTSPDDQWLVVIEQRLKDFKHFNQNRNLDFGDRGFKKWHRVNNIDGTHRENHVGYAIVKGNTKEECVNSLKNIVVHLNDWAARYVGRKEVTSNGAAEAVIEICNRFFARAYMTINKRSGKMVDDRVAKDKEMGLFRGRELQHRMGQAKENDDATVKWTVLRPWGMIDCDVDNKQAQAELENYLKDNNIEPFDSYESHDGKHYILKTRDASKLDFSFLEKYNSRNRKNDPNCEFKGDAKMILYSATGV